MPPITNHKRRLPAPLPIQIVQRILDARGHAPVVLRGDEDERVVIADFGRSGAGVGREVVGGWVEFVEGGGDGGFVEEGKG